MGLDLYAKVEPLLGFEEQKNELYEIFLHKLSSLGIKRFLDIGAGSGAFMQRALQRGFRPKGIDISCEMVRRARQKGLDVACKDICDVDERFEAAVAVFDVINYLSFAQLQRFFACVRDVLEDGGYFLCDMNTWYGFEEVAQGTLVIERENSCVAVEAEFLDEKLMTNILYFHAHNGCYTKEKDQIVQYYHDISDLKELGLRLVDIDMIALFGDEADKALLTWQKG